MPAFPTSPQPACRWRGAAQMVGPAGPPVLIPCLIKAWPIRQRTSYTAAAASPQARHQTGQSVAGRRCEKAGRGDGRGGFWGKHRLRQHQSVQCAGKGMLGDGQSESSRGGTWAAVIDLLTKSIRLQQAHAHRTPGHWQHCKLACRAIATASQQETLKAGGQCQKQRSGGAGSRNVSCKPESATYFGDHWLAVGQR